MSHVSFSKLISVNYPKIYPKPSPQPTLAEVLQSEPVKRLLSQPNIIIQTIPNPCVTQNLISSNNVILTTNNNKKRNYNGKETQGRKVRPEISIVPVEPVDKEESRLLPAKGDGKSEIALVVVKPEKKNCDHKEPCENIICDVSVQQYVDKSGILPMLAVGIKEDEINAPVSKHCKNPMCDALSIEHNRCRRALIKLYRFDKKSACDICNVLLKTRRARISHKNCTRKEVYRHNQSNGAEILREKMKKRELEMIEAARIKKKEYLDPETENKKYMEMLRNNKELIVIPKNISQPQPIITITTVSSHDQSNPSNQNNNSKELYGNYIPSLVFPTQSILLGKRPAADNNETPPMKMPKITNVFCSGLSVASVPSIQTNSGQFIKVTPTSQPNFIQPVALNDWLASQSNIVSSDKGRHIKPLLTPIRVVPITSLKSAPSLRHQTHGIPAFCLVPDSLPKPATVVQKLQNIQPAPAISPTPAAENETDNEDSGNKITPKAQKKFQGRRKSEEKNSKNFKCPYCLKGFSTDWYFKMHVAGHTGETLFTCKTCEMPFSNRYDMKKHMLNDHNDGECRCEICGQISICKSALEIHIRSHTGERPFHCSECDSSFRSSTDLKTHKRKRHDFIDCPYCNSHFVKSDLKSHLISNHMLTEDEAQDEISENQEQISNGNESSDNLDMEVDIPDNELTSNQISVSIKEELMIDEEAEETNKNESDLNRLNDSKKKKKTTQNGNKSRVSKPKGKTPQRANGKKKSQTSKNNSPVLKQVANNANKSETKPAVRRSSRRSNSNAQCRVCKDHFESTSHLENHLVDKSKDSIECKECKGLFHSQTEYKKHNVVCGKSSCKHSWIAEIIPFHLWESIGKYIE